MEEDAREIDRETQPKTMAERIALASQYLAEATALTERADRMLDYTIAPGLGERIENVRDLAERLAVERDALKMIAEAL